MHHKTLRGQGEGIVLPDGVAVGDALAHKGALVGGKLPAAGGVLRQIQPRAQAQLHQEKILGSAVTLGLGLHRACDKPLYIVGPVAAQAAQAAVRSRAKP